MYIRAVHKLGAFTFKTDMELRGMTLLDGLYSENEEAL